MLHVAADPANRAHHVLDDVGAGQRAAQLARQTEPRDGEDFVKPLQDAAGDAGRIAFQAVGEIADQLLGLLGVVQFPGLAQRAADRSVQRACGSRSMMLRAL